MLYIHPIIQITLICLYCWVLILGIQRFRALHLKHKTRFKWKQHVSLGKIVLPLIFLAMLLGLLVAKISWRAFLITGSHGKFGILIGILVIFGFFSGFVMDRTKKKRKWLPLLHGINNLAVLGLAVYQIISGIAVYRMFILGE